MDEIKPEFSGLGKNATEPECLSLAWSADGQTLFAGYSDNIVRVSSVIYGPRVALQNVPALGCLVAPCALPVGAESNGE